MAKKRKSSRTKTVHHHHHHDDGFDAGDIVKPLVGVMVLGVTLNALGNFARQAND